MIPRQVIAIASPAEDGKEERLVPVIDAIGKRDAVFPEKLRPIQLVRREGIRVVDDIEAGTDNSFHRIREVGLPRFPIGIRDRVGIFNRDPAFGHVAGRRALKRFRQVAEHVDVNVVIGIHKANVLALGGTHAGVARRPQTPILLVDHLHTTVFFRPCIGTRTGGIGRPVINDDDLKIAMRLANQARHAAVKMPLRIVRRHHNRNKGRCHGEHMLHIDSAADNPLSSTCESPRNKRLFVSYQYFEQIGIGTQPCEVKHEVRRKYRAVAFYAAYNIRFLVSCGIHKHFQRIVVDITVIDIDNRDIILTAPVKYRRRHAVRVNDLVIGNGRFLNASLKGLAAGDVSVGNHDKRHSGQLPFFCQCLPFISHVHPIFLPPPFKNRS